MTKAYKCDNCASFYEPLPTDDDDGVTLGTLEVDGFLIRYAWGRAPTTEERDEWAKAEADGLNGLGSLFSRRPREIGDKPADICEPCKKILLRRAAASLLAEDVAVS